MLSDGPSAPWGFGLKRGSTFVPLVFVLISSCQAAVFILSVSLSDIKRRD